MFSYNQYLDDLRRDLSANFNISQSPVKTTNRYDLYGEMNIQNTKFALVKEVKIYGYENNEYLFLRREDRLEEEDIVKELKELKHIAKDIARPHREHMSSHISLILVTTGTIPESVAKLARKFYSQKSFSFGFKGWADIYLTVLSLKDQTVETHRKNKITASFFLPEKRASGRS